MNLSQFSCTIIYPWTSNFSSNIVKENTTQNHWGLSYLYQLSCTRIPRDTDNIPAKHTSPWNWDSSPLAMGRSFVLSTFLSMSLSHMSLMMHPAPLMKKAPAPNRASSHRLGRVPGAEARAILQVQGQYSNHVPEICWGKKNIYMNFCT